MVLNVGSELKEKFAKGIDAFTSSLSISNYKPIPDFNRPLIQNPSVHHAFPSHFDAIDKKWVEPELNPDQIQPASIELKAGDKIWQVDYLFSSKQGNFEEDLSKYGKEIEINPDKPEVVLKKGKIYVLRSYERLSLPRNIEASADAKSTTGRVGCLCQLLSKGSYSNLPKGYGQVYPEHVYSFIEPHAFNLILNPLKTRFFQLRFRINGTGYINTEKLKEVYGKERGINWFVNDKKMPLEDVIDENALKMTLSTKRIYKQKNTKIPLDLTKKEEYNPKDFFEEIKGNGEIMMKPNKLYLFGTKESIEMGPYAGHLTRTDKFIESSLFSHFAGLFDPWFKGGITLEMWSPKPTLLRDGDYIGKVYFEESEGLILPSSGYHGSYKNQDAPKLPKIFKNNQSL